MPKLVELPTGQVAEFPDEMGDDEILSVLREKFPPTQDPYANDSAFDFSGERTLGGLIFEGNKAIPRGFANTILSSVEGATELVDAATNFVGLDNLIDSGDENAIVSVANAGKDWLNNKSSLKADPRYQDLWTTKFGEGVGSFASFLTPTLVLKGASILNRGRVALEAAQTLGKMNRAEKIATGAFAASTGAGEAVQRAKAAREEGLDVSEGQEDFATAQGALVGLTEMLPISRILGRVPKNIPKGEKDYLINLFKSAGIAAAEEGGQEVSAAILQNMIERGYNPNQEIIEGSLMDDLTIGGAVGALADITLNAFSGRRKGYMTEAQKENERKAREIEGRNDFQFRQEMAERKRIAELIESDPEAFQAEADRVQGLASTIPAPTNEEVMAFNQPSSAGAVATPETLGELYSLRIVGKLGSFFPTNTSFTVEQGEDVPTPAVGPDGTETIVPQPSFKVVDSTGKQYGQTLTNPDVASSLARNLNGEIVGQSIRGSILGTLMTSPQGYNPEQATNLFRYGFQTLNPESNNITYAALNDAAGTTTENGYIEEVSHNDILNSPKVLVKGGAGKTAYQVTMPNGKKRLAVGLTASQELNRKREEAGLPPVNSFNIRQAREALGGNIGTLSNPSVTGIQDQLQYAPVDIGGKPAVVSQAREVLTKRKTTLAEKAKAGFKQDGTSVLPDYIEFQSMEDAKRYADSLNKRNADKRFIPDALFEGKTDLFPQIKALLETKNIDAEMDSDEVGQLVKSFTGARDAKSMSLEDQKLFYARLRNLPGFSTKTKLPVFRLRPYSPEQFVKATQYQQQNPGAVTDEGLATALGLEPTSPRIAAIKSDLQKQTDARLQKEVLKNSRLPLVEGLRKALDDYGLSGVNLRLEESLRGPDGRVNEGYFDRMMDEVALAIDGIDANFNSTDEQRLNYLKEVLSHEVVHALRALDLWTAKEWEILSQAAARTLRPQGSPGEGKTFLAYAQEMYSDMSVDIQVEESVAELARAYIANKKLIGGKPRNLIERMIRLFQRLKAFVTNSGYQSFEAILNDMRSGAIASRDRGEVRSLRLTKNVPEGYVVADNVPEGVETRTIQDFDEAALEGADIRESRKPYKVVQPINKDTGRRYSVKDISKLRDEKIPLNIFAEQFSDRIKQSDTKLEDANRIAEGFIKEFVDDPSSFLPVVEGSKLSAETFLRMPDGTMYDPEKLEHANATDQTILVYEAMQNGNIVFALRNQANEINKKRAEDLSSLSEYLNNNSTYSLAEQALIMKGASKYGMRIEKEQFKLVPIADNNDTNIAVITAFEASAVAEELRKGKSLKQAMFDGISSAMIEMAKKNKESGLNGWKTFKKSDSEEDAVALKDGCAGRKWCTASSTGTSRNYLSKGDFHIYYENGEPIVALRTIDGRIAEPPRGSLDSQFMTEKEEKIAEEALRAGRVTGGEDYLDDRNLIADVIAGKHKQWPDLDLFVKTRRKYEVGHGNKKFDLPKPVLAAIVKERNERHSEAEWFKLGYTDGELTIPEGKGMDMKYVGGRLAIGTPMSSRSIVNSYPSYILDAFNDTGKVNIDTAAENVYVGIAKTTADMMVEALGFATSILDMSSKPNVYIKNALKAVEVVGQSIVEIDNANDIRAEDLSKIIVNEKAEDVTLTDNATAKIKKAYEITLFGNSVAEINSVDRASANNSSVIYAEEIKKKLTAEDSSVAYIKNLTENESYIRTEDYAQLFVKNFNSHLHEMGNSNIYIKYLKPDSRTSTFVFHGDGEQVLLVAENIEGSLLLGKRATAFVKNINKDLTARQNTKFFGETVYGQIASKDNAIIDITTNINDNQARISFLMNRDNSTVTFGTPFSLPKEYYDGMAVIDEKFPDTGRRYSRKDTGTSKDWSYSPLMKAVEQASPKITTAKQWDQWLDANAPKLGVTKDEIDFSGIKDFLALKSGKVSKEDINSYLDNNGVVVKDVMKLAEDSEDEAISKYIQNYVENFPEDFVNAEIINYPDGSIGIYTDDKTYEGSPSDVAEEIGLDPDDAVLERFPKEVRFEQYVLPGGENYRELALTLRGREIYRVPSAHSMGDDADVNRLFHVRMNDRTAEGDGPYEVTVRDAGKTKGRAGSTVKTFYTIGQANAFIDVKKAGGYNTELRNLGVERVLFIEEIQSDWGQQGREKGFKKPPLTTEDIETKLVSVNELDDVYGDKYFKNSAIKYREENGIPLNVPVVLFRLKGSSNQWGVNYSGKTEKQVSLEALESSDIYNEIGQEKDKRTEGTASGPFVTKTKNWVALALKRILALAENEGYKKVAFINGEQSAERYDLRKQIQKIKAKKNSAGMYLLDVDYKSKGSDTLLAKDEQELESYVGKQFAEKIIADLNPEINLDRLSVEQNEDFETYSVYSGDFKISPDFASFEEALEGRDSLRAGIAKPTPSVGSKMYAGLDLAIGGEGMKSFYDQIVPQVAKEVIKKVGGKNLSEVNIDDIGRQLAIEITPEMSERIAAGQVLFSRKAVPGTSKALPDTIDVDSRYSRKATQSPIEDAISLANEKYADYKTASKDKFFEHWNKLLNKVGTQLSPTAYGTRVAAKKAIADMEKWIKNNERFADYYDKDMVAVKNVLSKKYGKITDEDMMLFQMFAGITSPNTGLKSNIGDALALFELYKTDGNFDKIKMGLSDKNNLVIMESPFQISGVTNPLKARSLKVFERIIKQKGSVAKAVKFLHEPVTIEELEKFKRSFGYKELADKKDIKRNVESATGQDKLIPRMFLFGPKIGAYSLNLTGNRKYTTIDIWESRFIRSYFKGLFEKRNGLPEINDEHELFTNFNKLFKEEFDKLTGQNWDQASLQAMRWFYIINATNKAGYTGASTNDTISGYTERQLYTAGKSGYVSRGERDEKAVGTARRFSVKPESSEGQPAATSGAEQLRDRGGVRGGEGLLRDAYRPYQEAGRAGRNLAGLPNRIKVGDRIVEFEGFAPAQQLAEEYMKEAGVPYAPPTAYVRVDKELAAKIADEFQRMPNAPEDPLVQASYRQMMKETAAQYRKIMEAGLKVEFIKGDDPYGNPRNAILDVIENNHLWVFSTQDGFGTNKIDVSKNPLLEESEFKDINGQTMLANDLFRVVHDYFGHIMNGVGFRADGEENAWRSHASMYSPFARRAMTVETRGQNSWLNFGPNGEFNRTASPADTIYADQKVGLLPEWVSADNYNGVLEKAVEIAQKDTDRTPKTSVPLYGPNASPEALYVALNPEMGSKLSVDDKKRYSRRGNEPQYPPNIQKLIDQTPEASDETMGQTFIKILQMPSSKDFWDNIRQGLVFRGARLERQYRENPELAKMMADTSSLALYQMTDHARAITQAVITGGIPVYQNGGFKVVPFVYKGKNIERGLLEIMAPLHSKEHGNLERLAHRYAMAIRGERLNNEGKLTPIAPGELQALEAEIQKYRNPATGQPVVREWYDMWQAYNSNIVKYLKDTGVIDDAGAQLWMKQSDYIPFYREDKNGNLIHPKVFGGLHTAGQFKAVGKSSEDLNVDMVTAIVNNIDTAIAMGMKNVAQQRIIRDQINLGLASVLKQGETVGNRNSVSFKIAGKRYTAIIEDPLIYESMLPANEIPMDGLFGTMFRFPANLLRELIIRDPGYMVANMFRDTLSSYVITGAEVVPLWGTAKGFAGDIEKLRKLGVIGGYDLRMDKNGVRDFYDKEAKKMGMVAGVNWLNPVMAAWDVLGRVSERSEAATRLAVYEDILKRTGNEVEAQYQALSVMNYGRRGNNPLLRMITALVPFLNARIQGLDKLYQAGLGRIGAKYKTDTSGKVIPEVQRRKNFARFLFRAGLITGITALYYAMVSDDDEYENASPEIRDNYYIIPVMKGDTESGEPGLSVRLPIPFEIGIMFKVFPERLIAGIYGDDTSKDFKDSMNRALFSTLAMNPTPQAILPIGEAMVNKDFYTGRPIVPYYMENLLPEQQKTFYTNVVAEDIANKMGFSPMKVDHVLRGYGGTLGGYFMQAVDSMVRENEMVLPSTEWYQKPFIKRFFATANQPGLQNKFYELKNDVDGITQTINRLNEEGRYDELATFYAKNGHMYEMRKDLNYLEKQIKRLRDQRKIIEQMDIDPESKRQQIEQINMMISATLTSVPMYRKMAYDNE